MTNRLITACLAVAAIALYTVTTYAGFDGWGFTNWTLAGGTCKPVSKIPVAFVDYTSLAFGNVTSGSFRVRTVTLTNTGTDTLNNISHSMQTGAVFTNRSSTCSTLEPGQSCSWQVKFAPTAAGAVSDTSHLISTLPNVDVAVSGTGTTSTSYLIDQNFEAGGATAPTGFTNSSGPSITWNSTSSPLQGSYSVLLGAASSNVVDYRVTAAASLYTSMLIKVSDLSTAWLISDGYSPALANISRLRILTTGAIECRSWGGSQVASSAGIVAINTPIYLKTLTTAGSGSNGLLTAWYSSTGAPGSWTQACTSTDGNTTGQPGIWETAGVSTGTLTIDAIKVSASDITDAR